MSSEVNFDKSDFSPQVRSAYNKFTYLAAISIFISVIDISDKNTVATFDVENLDERWIEFSFFIAAVTLAWNYFARLMDERRVLYFLDKRIETGASALQSVVGLLQQDLDNASIELKSLPWKRSVETFPREVDKLINRIDNGKADWKVTLAVLERMREDVRRLLVRDINFIDEAEGAIEFLSQSTESLKKIEVRLHRKFQFIGWSKSRIITIDFIVPAVMLIALIYSFLFPNHVPNWITGIYGFLDFSANTAAMKG